VPEVEINLRHDPPLPSESTWKSPKESTQEAIGSAQRQMGLTHRGLSKPTCMDAEEFIRVVSCCQGAVMAALAERITVNPDQCGGRPCVRGLRIRVTDVLDLLASGLSPEQVLEELPDLEAADVTACLRFASRRLDHPIVAA
jgi:uncharacterized protein (DUF433 family)